MATMNCCVLGENGEGMKREEKMEIDVLWASN